jgi:hypothetical protein
MTLYSCRKVPIFQRIYCFHPQDKVSQVDKSVQLYRIEGKMWVVEDTNECTMSGMGKSEHRTLTGQ